MASFFFFFDALGCSIEFCVLLFFARFHFLLSGGSIFCFLRASVGFFFFAPFFIALAYWFIDLRFITFVISLSVPFYSAFSFRTKNRGLMVPSIGELNLLARANSPNASTPPGMRFLPISSWILRIWSCKFLIRLKFNFSTHIIKKKQWNLFIVFLGFISKLKKNDCFLVRFLKKINFGIPEDCAKLREDNKQFWIFKIERGNNQDLFRLKSCFATKKLFFFFENKNKIK